MGTSNKKQSKRRKKRMLIATGTGILLCCAVVLLVYIIKSGNSNSETRKFNDLDIKTQNGKIQVANYSDQTLFLAYIVQNGSKINEWATYPEKYKGKKFIKHKTGFDGSNKPQAAGSVRIDPGQCVLFSIPDGSTWINGRMWPMLGCNVQNQYCKVGCSALDLGLERSGYGPDGTTTTAPIDSKLEFTIFENNETDFFNLSGVDGITLPHSLEWVGEDDEVYQIEAALPQSACPKNEAIYESCVEVNCSGKPTYSINLQHKNTENEYLGCFSPCAYLTNGNKVNFPICKFEQIPSPDKPCCPHDGGNAGPSSKFYCCGGDMHSEACNKGPINQTQWCKTIHKHSTIKKFPKDSSAEGKPAIYCQAYDDITGLKARPSSENAKYKLTFWDAGFEWAGKK